MSNRVVINTFEDAILVLVSAQFGAPIHPALVAGGHVDQAGFNHRLDLVRELRGIVTEENGRRDWRLSLLSDLCDAVDEGDDGLTVRLSPEEIQRRLALLAFAVVDVPCWQRDRPAPKPAVAAVPASATLRHVQQRHHALLVRVEAALQASLRGPLSTAQLVELLSLPAPKFLQSLPVWLGWGNGLDDERRGEGAVRTLVKGDLHGDVCALELDDGEVPVADADVGAGPAGGEVERGQAEASEQRLGRVPELGGDAQLGPVSLPECSHEGVLNRATGE